MPPPGDENVVSGAAEERHSMAGGTNGKPVPRFTWKELAQLNTPENAHVAVRGKV